MCKTFDRAILRLVFHISTHLIINYDLNKLNSYFCFGAGGLLYIGAPLGAHSLNTMHVSINSITSKFQYILVAFGLFLIYNCAFVVEKSCVFKECAPKGA